MQQPKLEIFIMNNETILASLSTQEELSQLLSKIVVMRSEVGKYRKKSLRETMTFDQFYNKILDIF